MKKILALAALPLLTLTACDNDAGGFTPVDVPFKTHKSVLRGTYTGAIKGGTDAGKQLTLAFVPSYVNERSYRFTATGTLGDKKVTASGTVDSGAYHYLQAQTTPAPPTSFDFQLMYVGGKTQNFNCSYKYGAGDWECVSDSVTVLLAKQN